MGGWRGKETENRYGSVMGRQINLAMIGSGVINKMTGLGMPVSYKIA